MLVTDYLYTTLIQDVMQRGESLTTRNAPVKSLINASPIVFYEFPLVTLRKTAWGKAIREMEWFLSGDTKCPEQLTDWWRGQLNPQGHYLYGYSWQLRSDYDQINALIEGLIQHPYSRRHVITTWHPEQMAEITNLNQNPNTPTTCHNTITQFFVRSTGLHMITYQRSADLLLGVPHNWVQSWALLTWIAYKINKPVGSLRWNFGDLHIYDHESHINTAEEIIKVPKNSYLNNNNFRFMYQPTGDEFKARDFSVIGIIPDPQTKLTPKLL